MVRTAKEITGGSGNKDQHLPVRDGKKGVPGRLAPATVSTWGGGTRRFGLHLWKENGEGPVKAAFWSREGEGRGYTTKLVVEKEPS